MTRLNNIPLVAIAILMALLVTPALQAQQGKNPFDLSNKQKVPEQKTEEEKNTTQNPFDLNSNNINNANTSVEKDTPAEANNPFDISAKTPSAGTAGQTSPTPVLQPEEANDPKAAGNFLFWITTLLLVFLTILFTLYKSLLGSIYSAFLNENMLNLLHRDQGIILKFPYLVLYLFFFLSIAFFLYLIIHHFGWSYDTWSLYFYCLAGVGGVYLAKHIFLRILGVIYPINKDLRQYSFTIVIFNIVLGLGIIPFSLLLAFGPESIHRPLIFIVLALIGLLFAFRGIRSLVIGSRYIASQKFHFFMYLCTVEIAPTVVLVKLLLLWQGGVN